MGVLGTYNESAFGIFSAFYEYFAIYTSFGFVMLHLIYWFAVLFGVAIFVGGEGFIGFDWQYRKMEMGALEENLFGQTNTKHSRPVFSPGVEYILPMLIKAQAEAYTNGNFRLQFELMDIPPKKKVAHEFNVESL